MSAPSVTIVGSGFAGLAAAHAASAAGGEVTMVRGGAGAASLYAGAADDDVWDELERASQRMGTSLVAPPLADAIVELAEALELWVVPKTGDALPRIATTAGVIRSTRAYDPALLDLERARGRTVLVPRADRAGWDADSLVRCLQAETPPDAGITFEAIGAPVLRFDEERDIVDIDLAARHDEMDRLDWLAARLGPEVERRGRARTAVLLGPWLGASVQRASVMSQKLGVPIGEALAASSGTAGQRFEAARDRLLARIGTRIVSGWAASVVVAMTGARAKCAIELSSGDSLSSDAVVLASGGLVGGGIRYEPPEHGAEAEGADRMRTPLSMSPNTPGARLSLGRDTGPASSVHGPVLDERAWPVREAPGALEIAGVLVSAEQRVASQIYAAGDVVFGGRRTVLTAVRSGLLAGKEAAEGARTSAPPPKTRPAPPERMHERPRER